MQGLNNVVPPPDPAVSFCGPSAIVSALPDDRVWSNASAQSLFPAADSHASCCYQGQYFIVFSWFHEGVGKVWVMIVWTGP